MALSPEDFREYIEYLHNQPDETSERRTSRISRVYSAFPVGSFEDFQHKVDFDSLSEGYETVTFALLVADARQSESRDYLLNYLNHFHRRSRDYFRFYIPGFTKEAFGIDHTKAISGLDNVYKNQYLINIENTKYFFDDFLFERFIEKLEEELGVKYTYNPMLVLFEMKPGHWGEARRVVFELDDLDNHDIRRSGMFFSELLDITKEVTSLEDITRKQKEYVIKDSIIDRIIGSIDIPLIQEIKNSVDDITRYRIKK